jgi:hypothetical protein
MQAREVWAMAAAKTYPASEASTSLWTIEGGIQFHRCFVLEMESTLNLADDNREIFGF